MKKIYSQEVLDDIFLLRRKGFSFRAIASVLNEQGYLTLKGKNFTRKTVANLFRKSEKTF